MHLDLDQSQLGYHGAMYATQSSGVVGAAYWVLDQVARHGPSWSLVPPLMFGASSLAGAWMSGRRARHDLAIAAARADQERRQNDEIHRLRLEHIKTYGRDLDRAPLPFVPSVDPIH